MSLVTRLLGVALSLSGGAIMGYAQALDTVSAAAGNVFFDLGTKNPLVGPVEGNYLGGLLIQLVKADYGTYWSIGIVLAIFGFILIARGDPKPRSPLERVPLLSPPPSAKQQE